MSVHTELAHPSNLTEKQNSFTVPAPVDIYENKDEILMIADFPGVATEDLNIRLDGAELHILGSPSATYEDAPPLTFSRTFRVPNTVDPSSVTAELSHGVLRVHLTKAEAAKPRRITVHSSTE